MRRAPELAPLALHVEREWWHYKVPFRTTGHVREVRDVILVTLESAGHVGRGEAAGVRYRGETVDSLSEQIETARPRIEAGLSRETLRAVLPAGGARNALDCALWELEARLSGRRVWELAGLPHPKPLLTTFTCGAEDPETMACAARDFASARAIKIKLTGEPHDAQRVRAVREARPDVWLCVDGNQGFTRAGLERLMPELVACEVQLIEQPFPAGEESLMDGLHSPIAIAADESVQQGVDLGRLAGRFNMINIKLDKCGGLTEGLAMAEAAKAAGLELMVGNMGGTSIAMAPAFVLGQLCRIVDLDGPALLTADRAARVSYADGLIMCPEDLWG